MKSSGIFLVLLGLFLQLNVGIAKAAGNGPVEIAELPYLLSLYEHLHRNPEISFQEARTAKRLSKELSNAGFEVTSNVGGHGVVALLKNGLGPTVMLRTDMDALPVKEQTGKPYASTATTIDDTGKTVSVMHACGHDIHMTTAVGTARWLSSHRDQWQGTVIIIAQPAEERGAGARAMLADGLFERFPRPDYNLALHVSAYLPAGTVGYAPGYAMANVDSVDILVKGVGGHGAYPHKTKDPVVLAARVISELQTLISRELSPLDSGVITVGSIHGGTKRNIIPDSVKLELTVRSYTDETRQQLLTGIARTAEAAARGYGLADDLLPVVTNGNDYTPAVYNTPELTERMLPVLSEVLGDSAVIEIPPVMGGEDFARYGRQEPRIPSHMFMLGSVEPRNFKKAELEKTSLPSLHSALFSPEPKQTLETGVKVMTAMVEELLPVSGNTQQD
ncbi:MAG: amidohydrolase [Porticoccaceae bacterium]|nr:amidohydrolase [Porticoccaceae bacterium]